MEEEVLEPLAQYFCTFLHCVAVDSCPHPLHLRKGAKTGGESKGGVERKQEEKGPTGIPWNGSCSLPNCYAKSA